MVIDPEILDVNTVYKLMSSNTIFPRPITWILTEEEGELNGNEQNILFLKIDACYYADEMIDECHNVRLKSVGQVGRDYLVDAKRIKV